MLTNVKEKPLLSNILTSILLISCALFSNGAFALSIHLSYIKSQPPQTRTLPTYLMQPTNSGLLGSKLAIKDSNTTGQFLKQEFSLHYVEVATQQLLARLEKEYQAGHRIFILDTTANLLIQADEWAKNKGVMMFNVSESADELRFKQCLTTIFHTIPSNAMKTDALAQWLLYRRLNKVFLVNGQLNEDAAIRRAFKRSAKRFGLAIVEEKTWTFNTDLRRSTQQEIPLFTQSSKDYDAVFVADKLKRFAEYLPFNTYLPRPVIGSAGLEALAWHEVIEQWGAAQLQDRFTKLSQRAMNEVDFAGYLAVRSVAQIVHKLNSNDINQLTDYIQSSAFELAAYKGRKLNYRSWSNQLRMPIALVHPHALVTQSPQPGFLHPTSELDTLGYDQQEASCR